MTTGNDTSGLDASSNSVLSTSHSSGSSKNDLYSWKNAPPKTHAFTEKISKKKLILNEDSLLRILLTDDIEGLDEWISWRSSVLKQIDDIVEDLFEPLTEDQKASIHSQFHLIYEKIHGKGPKQVAPLIQLYRGDLKPHKAKMLMLSENDIKLLDAALKEKTIIGRSHQLLLHQIKESLKVENSYADYFPIVNSSGTGKTRTALLLADEGVYIIYVCFRRPNENSGFPLATPYLLDMLSSGNIEQNIQLLYMSFANKIFQALSNNETPRAFLEHQVVTTTVPDTEKDSFWSSIYSDFIQISKNYGEFDTEKTTLFYNDLNEKVKKMKENPTFIVVLDEIRTLFTESNNSAFDHDKFEQMRCGLKAFGEKLDTNKRPFTLMIDTTSRIVDVIPPTHLNSTSRIATGSEDLLPPFYSLDTFNATIIASVNACLSLNVGEKCNKEILSKVGRPLWNAYKNPKKIVTIARAKLICSSHFDIKKDLQFLACIMARYCLNKVRVDLSSELVASHMRVCSTITDDRMVVSSEITAILIIPTLRSPKIRYFSPRLTIALFRATCRFVGTSDTAPRHR